MKDPFDKHRKLKARGTLKVFVQTAELGTGGYTGTAIRNDTKPAQKLEEHFKSLEDALDWAEVAFDGDEEVWGEQLEFED